VVQTANLAAMLYLVLTAIIFIPLTLIAMAAGSLIPGGSPAGGLLFLLAPIAYAIFGWIFVALSALLYNLCAGWVGGVEFTLEDAPQPTV
jgi:hypothetical protein